VSHHDEVVLLATCAAHPDGDEDGEELLAALNAQGIEGRWVSWDDSGVDWDEYLVVLRSTWDYTLRRAEFLSWTRSVRRLVNPYEVVRWNSDKTYLRDLAGAGVPIVPTEWVTPELPTALPTSGDYVIKPSVGAGSRGAGRFTPEDTLIARAHIESLHAARRTVMIQPYIDGVDSAGETALIYIEGRYSHAVGKAPLLTPGTVHGVGERSLFAEETITLREASDDELAIGSGIVSMLTARFGAPLLYTRVDLLPGSDGPVLIELELTEPSLFLGYGPGSADLLATAIAARL
jgi:hypothetical protein